MSEIKWYGDGIYSRMRARKVGGPLEVFTGRVWVAAERKFRHFKLGTSLRQAEKKMRKILGNPEEAIRARERKRAPVRMFKGILEEFLAKYRSRGGTNYYANVTKRLKEHFGHRPATEITPQAMDRYLLLRREEKKEDGDRKVGESTLRKEIIALGTVLRWAKRRGLVGENPVAEYDKPKEPSDRSIAILSSEQETALRDACQPWVWDVVEWAVYSGMRRGEILNVRWRDIDQVRGVIHTGSKTQRSARTIPLHISSRLPAVLARRPRHINSDLVFCERDGEPLNMDVLNRAVEAAAESAKISKQRGVMWNRFRHTWATRLAAMGKVSIFEISKWMGNSVAICERHYAAYLPGSLQKAAGLLDGPVADAKAPVALGVAGGDRGLPGSPAENVVSC